MRILLLSICAVRVRRRPDRVAGTRGRQPVLPALGRAERSRLARTNLGLKARGSSQGYCSPAASRGR